MIIYIELEHGLPLMYKNHPVLVEDWDLTGDVLVSYLDGSDDVVRAWELELPK